MIALGRKIAWIVALLTFTSGECYGIGGKAIEMPAPLPATSPVGPRYSKLSGLGMSLDTRWFDSGGYRPVAIRFSRANPPNSDLAIAVELRFGDSDRGEPTVSVRQDLVLRAGETEVEGLIRCPSDVPHGGVRWTVDVNGTRDAELSYGNTNRPVVASAAHQHRGLRVLRPFQDDRNVSQRDKRSSYGERQVGVPIFRCEPLEDWIDYTSADVLLLDLAKLQELSAQSPDRVATVRRWLLAGGTVWVERAGDAAEDYLEVDRLLEVASWRYEATKAERGEDTTVEPSIDLPLAAAEDGAPQVTEDGAKQEGKAVRSQRLVPVDGADGWGYQPIRINQAQLNQAAVRRGLPAKEASEGRSSAPRDTRGWYAVRRVGFGQLLAFKGRHDIEPPMPLSHSESVRRSWWMRGWAQRHGLEPGSACPQFGNLLIPGVGVAPITEFQILITLFVLTIGPLNYWLLWRRQQLQLLVLTAPLCALLVTLGFVGYAAVADGFGVKARVRSITLLNQTTGEAASWSRVSHYVATQPEGPAILPDDCVAYPVKPAWEAALASNGERRRIEWTDSTQRLTSGWIPSRTAVQHLIIRCRESPAGLTFVETADEQRVSNQLGVPIELLVVRNSQGEWRRADGIESGSTARLESVTRLEAIQAYRQLALENVPEFPIGAGKAVEETLEKLGDSRSVRRLQRSFSEANLDDNLGEQLLDAVSGLSGGRSIDLPPRSYVAVTRQSVETPLGWDSVEEIGSFHVVVGRW